MANRVLTIAEKADLNKMISFAMQYKRSITYQLGVKEKAELASEYLKHQIRKFHYEQHIYTHKEPNGTEVLVYAVR